MPLASNDLLAFSNCFSLSSGASESARIKMVQCFSLYMIGTELPDAALVSKVCLSCAIILTFKGKLREFQRQVI